MLGNILLVFSALFLFGLLNVTSSPMPGGDRGMGYGLMLFFCGLGFALTSGLLAWNLGATHHLDWLPTLGGSRGWLIFFIWATFSIATFAGATFKTEWHPGELPVFLRWLALAQVALWLPVLMLGSAFWLLHFGNDAAPPAFVQIPMKVGFAVGLLMCMGLLFGFFREEYTRAKARQSERPEHRASGLDRFEEGILAEIDSCDVSKDMVFILVNTDMNRNPIIRERALAKIKTRPDWQEELVRRLDSGWAAEPFTFLASNEVDDKSLFPEAVRKGVLHQAEIIRKGIKESRSLYADQYGSEVERVLRTVEKMEGMGVDYLPAVRELRAAFEEPSPSDKPTFRAVPILDKWLKKR